VSAGMAIFDTMQRIKSDVVGDLCGLGCFDGFFPVMPVPGKQLALANRGSPAFWGTRGKQRIFG